MADEKTSPARWNDQAIDRLADTVDDHGNELAALRPALNDLGKVQTVLASLLESHREERHIARKFRAETRRHFARIEESAHRAPTKSWGTILAAVIGLVGVVLAALISAYVALKTGAAK